MPEAIPPEKVTAAMQDSALEAVPAGQIAQLGPHTVSVGQIKPTISPATAEIALGETGVVNALRMDQPINANVGMNSPATAATVTVAEDAFNALDVDAVEEEEEVVEEEQEVVVEERIDEHAVASAGQPVTIPHDHASPEELGDYLVAALAGNEELASLGELAQQEIATIVAQSFSRNTEEIKKASAAQAKKDLTLKTELKRSALRRETFNERIQNQAKELKRTNVFAQYDKIRDALVLLAAVLVQVEGWEQNLEKTLDHALVQGLLVNRQYQENKQAL